MIKLYSISIFILLWMLAFPVLGQNSIKVQGKILDKTTKQGLLANISLLDVSDSSFVAFSSSDTAGFYEISTEMTREQTFILKVTSFGFLFSTKNIAIVNGITQSHNFELEPDSHALDEVVVKTKRPPFQIKNDTTEYQVKDYKDGSERTIEDVLKKMPGIQVDENGNILAKGKPIEKIMIEGEEFFGSNYKLLSRNINPNTISKVQAIDNFEEEAVMKGFKNSNKIALNFRLDDKNKAKISGSAELALGSNKRYSTKLVNIGLYKKFKIGLVGASGNTGTDETSFVSQGLDFQKEQNGVFSQHSASLSPFYDINRPRIPNVDQSRYRMNLSLIGGGNIGFKISEKTKINSYIFGSTEKLRFENETNENFIVSEKPFTFKDSTLRTDKPKSINVNTVFNYQNNLRTSFRISHLFKKELDEIGLKVASTNEELTESLGSFSNKENTKNQLNIRLLHRLNEQLLLVANTSWQKDFLPELSQIQSQRFSLFYGKSLPAINQQVDLKSEEVCVNIGLKKIINRSVTSIEIKASSRHESIYAQSDLQQAGIKPFQNNLYKKSIITQLEQRFLINRLTVLLGLDGNFVSLKSTDTNQDKGFTFPNSTLSFKYPIGEFTSLLSVSGIVHQLPNVIDLANIPILSDYKTMVKGTTDAILSRSNYSFFTYSRMRPDKHSTLIAGFQLISTKNPFVYSYNIGNLLGIYERVVSVESTGNSQINFDVDKYFINVKTRIKLQGSFIHSKQVNALKDNQLEVFRFNQTFTKLSVAPALKLPVNIHLGSNFSFSQQQGFDRSFVNTRPYMIVIYNNTQAFSSKLTVEHQTWNFSGNQQTTFVDLYASLKPKNSAFSFYLEGKNLLNNHQIRFSDINNVRQFDQFFNLQPRFVIVGVSRVF